MGNVKGEAQLPTPPADAGVSLKMGMQGDAVLSLQKSLNKFGYKLTEDGKFGPVTDGAVRDFQAKHGLTVDGIAGPFTLQALVFIVPTLPPVIVHGETPWMDWMKAREGWTEFDHDKELSAYWKYAGLPQFTTVIGTEHAWCAMTINAALHDTGYKGNNRADAASFRTYGTPCDYIYGAILSMRHVSGNNHVTFFAGWQDEAAKLAYCLGGNQSNALKVSVFNLSGNKNDHDEVIGGPRWPVKA